MKRTLRWSSPRSYVLVSKALCWWLIVTIVVLPFGPVIVRAGAQNNSPFLSQIGILNAPAKSLASLLTLLQGGGLPAVPGPNLPDLDVARATQPTEPVAPASIASTQACSDCTPCPTCGPGSNNHSPVAQAGGPYYGTAGTAVVVNGLISFDLDAGDDISVYAWSFGDNSGIVNGPMPSHTYQSAGSYTVSLTVTDSHNATSTETTTASITPPPPPVPPAGPTQGNGAQFIAQSAPTTMVAGQSYPVSVTMRNTGTTTWSAAHLYRLGSQSPQDNSLWGQARIHLTTDAAPGAEVAFNFTVVAPYNGVDEPPPAQFHWRMLQDGVQWFGESTSSQTITIVSNYQPGNPGVPQYTQFSSLFASRIAVEHRTGQTGEDLLSGNYNWGLGLVGLAGRSGLNLNLGLSYNSLAPWTKVVPAVVPGGRLQATSFTFDADRGSPSAGFRLGFPTIQGPFYNTQTSGSSYLMLLPSGGRVELRRVGLSNVYEAADSSYLQLVDGGNGSLLVRTTDGTQRAYWSINSEYRCTEVKDRNGNYLSIKYDPINGIANLGRMTAIVDTLGRTINFNYDTNYRLQSITQVRNGQTHTWATFGYSALTIATNFSSSSGPAPVVLGLPANHIVSVLTQVGLQDGSRVTFDYSSWGQVYRINHFAADGHLLNYNSYNLPLNNSTAQTDSPRFTERQDWAENWNGNTPAVTNFQIDPTGTSGQLTTAAGTSSQVTYKESFTTEYDDWRRGLVTRTDVYAGNSTTPEKTTVTAWTQDDLSRPYPLNPRATGITISDANGNRRRTTIDYGPFGLPADTFEWGPEGVDAWTLLRRTHTDYEISQPYLNRRLLGLTMQQFVFGPEDNGQRLYSKVSFEFDAGGEFLQNQGSPVQQDVVNYGTGLGPGRGNITRVRRWNVNHETDITQSSSSTIGYNTAGSPIFKRDPLGHQTTLSYTDSFSSDGNNTTVPPGVTLAYPTTVSVNDPGPISSTVRYHYDLGAITREQDPKGAAQTTLYDSTGRITRTTNTVNSAYTRFVYPPSQSIVNKFTTINDLATEGYTAKVSDGAGRVRAVAGDLPNSSGHYSGQFLLYDSMGRAVQQTNPTEMTSTWSAAGDDLAGWHASSQTFDWQGRPLLTTNTDGTTKDASYGGCGCAGGEVVTLTDEGTLVDIDPGAAINNVTKRRQQKIYSDPLGRIVKTEMFNWQGGSIYATTVKTFNALDQVKRLRQYQGAESGGIYQETTMAFDGHGRLKTRHLPEQKADANISGSTDHTTWEYFADDTVQSVTDARNITTTFGYNGRHLLTSITYPPAPSLPAGVAATANVSYSYDSAGNRLSMSDSAGNILSYDFDTLSRLRSEARQFPGLAGTYTLAYEYNLAGQVKQVTDQSPGSGTSFSYVLDNVGRLTSVTSTGLGATAPLASNAQYRASGALKHRESGNGTAVNVSYNARGMITQYSLSGVKEITNAPRAEGSDFNYYADGRVKFASDHYGRSFYQVSAHDKSYQYDHAGRVQAALTGVMANDVLNGTATQFAGSGSYLQKNTYDGWNNLAGREGLYWNEIDELAASYDSHNRNAEWSYDADGRLLSMNEPPFNQFAYAAPMHTFDAAGQHVKNTQTTSRQRFDLPGDPVWTTVATVDAAHDGDGQQSKRVQTIENVGHGTTIETSYYLRSSVLGQVITEYSEQGTRRKSYIYGGRALLATGDQAGLLWHHNNPVTGDGRRTDAQGKLIVAAYLDPQGVDAGASDPAVFNGEPPPLESLPEAGAYAAFLPRSLGGSGRCAINYADSGCGFVSGLLENGLAKQCLNNDCDTQQITVIGRNGAGDIISKETIDVREGDPGWNGELDGTYRVIDKDSWGASDGKYFFSKLAKYGARPNEFYRLITRGTTLNQKSFVQEGLNRAAQLFDAQRCKNFINALLQRAAGVVAGHRWLASDNFVANSEGVFPGVDGAATLWKYQDAVYNGWVTASGETGVSGNSVIYGSTLPSGNFPVTWNKEFFDLSPDEAGLHTLHESLHQFSGFNDQTLANAARLVNNPRGGSRDYSTVRDAVGTASEDLNGFIRNYCSP